MDRHPITEAAVLINTVEFEGGEGTPCYGYAGRLRTHEVALCEQVHLFGVAWTGLATAEGRLSQRARAIGSRLQALARRPGHPADPPPSPTTADHPDAALRQVLEHRAEEIEEILASLDRLTGPRPSS